jgi:Ca2+-binding RTX toxin-like protein
MQPYITPYSEYVTAHGFGGGIGDGADCNTTFDESTFPLSIGFRSKPVQVAPAAQFSLAPVRELRHLRTSTIHLGTAASSRLSNRIGRIDPCLRTTAARRFLHHPHPNFIVGTENADTLVGTSGRDVMLGLGGDDTIVALGGNDLICGGEGNDGLSGVGGNDFIFGGNGDDVFLGGAGNDFLRGRAGTDIMEGGRGVDHMSGGGDDLDIVAYLFSPAGESVNFASGRAYGGEGFDRLSGFNAVIGSQFDDRLTGTSGEQWFVPLGGNDKVDGGADTDIIDFFLAAGINVNLATGQAEGEGSDALANLEVVVGTSSDDMLTGDANHNWLYGGLGNDAIDGGLGSNTLEGNDGTDACTNGDFYDSCENQGAGLIGPEPVMEQPPAPTDPVP